MSNNRKSAIWGTGSLSQRYLEIYDAQQDIHCFIDSTKKGTFLGKTILSPNELDSVDIDEVIICSSYVNEIVPKCLESGLQKNDLFVVLPRTLKKVPLALFHQLSNQEYYFLPWSTMQDVLDPVLSSDIMFPDAYKDIAKSVAYTYISSVSGDFAEFGTCSGYSASLIAHTMNYYNQHLKKHEEQHNMEVRNLCLFDSFQGFPLAQAEADVESPHVASGAWGEGTAKGLTAVQLKSLCENFLDTTQINLYEGWYKDTLSNIPDSQQFGFVHMDCDLYESTYDVLHHLFASNHLSEGAILLFDNWYSNKASSRYGEQRAWIEIEKHFDIQYTDLGMYGCVGNRKIIHQYATRSN